MSMLLLSFQTLRLHVPFIIFLLNQLSWANLRHSVKFVVAVFRSCRQLFLLVMLFFCTTFLA